MHTTGHVTPRRGGFCGALAAISLLCGVGVLGVSVFGATAGLVLSAVSSTPAHANKVGVAAAVNPDAFSSLSGVPNQQLNIGKSIFYNERIKTTANGLVQVLLVDGSTFTVGPNSNLVIDKFVYDPNKKTGEVVATFSKGSMRFIGGKLSKNDGGVKVNTPSGALAIRGGMFQGNTQKKIYSFLYGHSMTLQGRNGKVHTVYQPGYTLDLSTGTGNVRPTTAEDTAVFAKALSSSGGSSSSGNGNNGGGAGGGQQQAASTGQQAAGIQNAASQAVSDATTTQIQTAVAEQLIRLEKLRSDPVSMPPVMDPPVIDNTEDPGPPSVIKNGGTFEGFASGFLLTGQGGTGEPELLRDGTVKITLDPNANTVTANIDVTHERTTKDLLLISESDNPILTRETQTVTNFDLGFLGSGNAAYVDDSLFLAIEDNASTSVVRQTSTSVNIDVFEFDITRSKQTTNFEDVSHAGNLASVTSHPELPAALCSKCDFLKFGFWSSNVTYDQNVDTLDGWWVASSDTVQTVGQLPQTGTAFYAGNAVGTFARSIEGGDWQQGLATGDVELDWDFALRSGDLEIKDFGNSLGKRSFGGNVSSTGAAVGFSGDITRGAGGTMRGTFVGARQNFAPRAVMGDFNARGQGWRANGIYGADAKRFNPSGSLPAPN